MNDPVARVRDRFRQAVEAARQAGREARDKQVAEFGQRAVDDQVPGWANRWLDHDRSEPGAVVLPADEGVEPEPAGWARTARMLAELEAVEDTTGSLREPAEELEP